jgi:predicted nucleic acid-binding protein
VPVGQHREHARLAPLRRSSAVSLTNSVTATRLRCGVLPHGPDVYRIEWQPTDAGEAASQTIADELAADPVLVDYRDEV